MKRYDIPRALNERETSKKAAKPRESDLRQQRMNELLESIQQNVLQQIIGPFGLTTAMFDDKDGGNTTTQHNANKGIFSKEEEKYKNNKGDYSYEKARKDKINEHSEKGYLNSKEFKDEYTEKMESSTRARDTDGKIVANYELDHTIPREELNRKGGWMMSAEERKKLASNKDNLHFTTKDNNRAKSDTAAKDALSGINVRLLIH